jgi:hypothetical protein
MAAITQYTEWYNLPTNDPYNGSYSLLFAPLDAVAAPLAPAALLTLIATGADSKSAFMFLGPNNLIHVIHRIRRFVPAIGMPPMPYDNTTLATLGDLTPLGPNTIEVPANIFTRTAVIAAVLTPAAINVAIGANPDQDQIAPDPNAPAGDVGDVRSRSAMLIPPNQVGPILAASISPGGLSPKSLWIDVAGPMQADAGLAADCLPFIDWCRLAYSHGVGAANPLHLVQMPPPRFLEPPLVADRTLLLHQDIPGRATFIPRGGLDPVVEVIGALRADMATRAATTHQRDTQRRAADVLPSKRWGVAVDRLFRLCQVGNEGDLPEVWLQMARAGAKADRQTIQFCLDLEEPLIGASGQGGLAPICNPELSKQLGRLCFQTHKDDLAVGISIFSICHPTQESAAKASEAAGLYDQQIQGVAGITLAESISLKAAQSFLLPTSLIEIKHVCWGYHRLLAVVLGVDHTVTSSFGTFVRRLEGHEVTLHPYFHANVVRCAGILRFIQIRMFNWVRAQLYGNGTVERPPNFDEVLDWIDEDRWTVPSLPSGYLTPAKMAPVVKVMPRPANTPASPQVAGYFEVQDSMLDKTAVPIQKGFVPKKHIAAHGNPPTNDKGGLMCLSFHVRGACRHECDRGPSQGAKNDHRHHNAAESARLAEYLAKVTPAVEN